MSRRPSLVSAMLANVTPRARGAEPLFHGPKSPVDHPDESGEPNPMRVDVHTHVAPAGLPDFASAHGDPRWPVFRVEDGIGRLWVNGVEVRTVPAEAFSAARRVEHMDAVGADLHVLSPL